MNTVMSVVVAAVVVVVVVEVVVSKGKLALATGPSIISLVLAVLNCMEGNSEILHCIIRKFGYR